MLSKPDSELVICHCVDADSCEAEFPRRSYSLFIQIHLKLSYTSGTPDRVHAGSVLGTHLSNGERKYLPIVILCRLLAAAAQLTLCAHTLLRTLPPECAYLTTILSPS